MLFDLRVLFFCLFYSFIFCVLHILILCFFIRRHIMSVFSLYEIKASVDACICFSCCIRHYHKLSNLRQCPSISSQLCRLEVQLTVIGFSTQNIIRLKSGCLVRRVLFCQLWGRISYQAHSGDWQNLAPCVYRIEVSVFLLAVGQGLLLVPRVHSEILPCGPNLLSIRNLPCVESLSCFRFL